MLKMLTKRFIKTGTFLGVCVSIPPAIWFSLTYQPSYYRAMVSLPHIAAPGLKFCAVPR